MQTSLARLAARPTGALTVWTDMKGKFEDMVYKGTIGTTLDTDIRYVAHELQGDDEFKTLGITCPKKFYDRLEMGQKRSPT